LSKHILNTYTANKTNAFRGLGFVQTADQANTTATAYQQIFGKLNEKYLIHASMSGF